MYVFMFTALVALCAVCPIHGAYCMLKLILHYIQHTVEKIHLLKPYF